MLFNITSGLVLTTEHEGVQLGGWGWGRGEEGEILCFVYIFRKCVCGGGADRVIEYYRQFPAFFECVLFFFFLLVPINFVINFLSCGNLKKFRQAQRCFLRDADVSERLIF